MHICELFSSRNETKELKMGDFKKEKVITEELMKVYRDKCVVFEVRQ